MLRDRSGLIRRRLIAVAETPEQEFKETAAQVYAINGGALHAPGFGRCPGGALPSRYDRAIPAAAPVGRWVEVEWAGRCGGYGQGNQDDGKDEGLHGYTLYWIRDT